MTRMNAEEFGRWGEEVAAVHLEGMGYELVERNWRSEYGEIDLVTRHGDVWIFVEVKARRTGAFGTPEEAVTAAKQRRLLEAAQAYLAEHDLDEVAWRIDVVAITVAGRGTSRPIVEVYQNAVSEW
jgi:putative endonuclease